MATASSRPATAISRTGASRSGWWWAHRTSWCWTCARCGSSGSGRGPHDELGELPPRGLVERGVIEQEPVPQHAEHDVDEQLDVLVAADLPALDGPLQDPAQSAPTPEQEAVPER